MKTLLEINKNTMSDPWVNTIRNQFPMINQTINGKKLIYLDTAATAYKPQIVISTINNYYNQYTSNVHRGLYTTAAIASDHFERARLTVASFIGASSEKEVIFTRGTTDSINTIAQSLCESYLQKGDTILVSEMEHHSNLIPWQNASRKITGSLKPIRVLPDGTLDYDEMERTWDTKTKVVALTHMSNVLGTRNDIERVIALAHKNGALVVIDAAQSIAHERIDVKKLDCDFLAFSSHKIYGPTGCGVLYGKASLLDKMEPVQGGGNMISAVWFDHATWNELPYKFEAGTPPIAEAIGLGAAIDFAIANDFTKSIEHEQMLTEYALQKMKFLDYCTIYGKSTNRGPVVSFAIDGVHPHDLAQFLDSRGIAIRAGHHCAQPLMRILKVPALARASFGMYTSEQDIDNFIDALSAARRFFL
jgi:cysteine desulfurase/selenocysteine lyase